MDSILPRPSSKLANSLKTMKYCSYFKAWGRPFNFVMEAYYKYLWDVVSFDYDNTLISYSGRNDAKALHVFTRSGLDRRASDRCDPASAG